MLDKEQTTTDIISSVSGVLLFLSIAHYIDTDSLSKYAWMILAVGFWLLFWPQTFLRWTEKISFINEVLVVTVSHVLIFIGLETYLSLYANNYAWLVLIISILMMNYNRQIVKLLFRRKGG